MKTPYSEPYTMHRFTIIAPHVRNDGSMSGYPAELRAALRLAGIDGWTETETHGSWQGKREAGTTFEILREDHTGSVKLGVWLMSPMGFARQLAIIAREAMPDQDAIQVTYGETCQLLEG